MFDKDTTERAAKLVAIAALLSGVLAIFTAMSFFILEFFVRYTLIWLILYGCIAYFGFKGSKKGLKFFSLYAFIALKNVSHSIMLLTQNTGSMDLFMPLGPFQINSIYISYASLALDLALGLGLLYFFALMIHDFKQS
jgi:hypothetical protein